MSDKGRYLNQIPTPPEAKLDGPPRPEGKTLGEQALLRKAEEELGVTIREKDDYHRRMSGAGIVSATHCETLVNVTKVRLLRIPEIVTLADSQRRPFRLPNLY